MKKGKRQMKIGGASQLSQQFDRLVDLMESRSIRTSTVRSKTLNSSILDVVEVLDV